MKLENAVKRLKKAGFLVANVNDTLFYRAARPGRAEYVEFMVDRYENRVEDFSIVHTCGSMSRNLKLKYIESSF